MATEADISDLISPMKIEAEDKEHNSGNSSIIKEELFEVNGGIVKSIEGDTFLQSPSFIDGEVERNTEDNQLNSIRKMNGSQNGDKIDIKTDENNSNPASEHTDCSQGTTFYIEKVSDVCPLKEKRDDTLTAKAILSQQDSTETSFKEEDGSQNKSSESLLTEKVDSIEISKQELDHEAKDIVEDNLNDKSEALGNVEMLVTEAPEEIETTSPSDTPDQNPAKEDVTTISGDIKVFATSEEKNHAAIDWDEKNEEAEVAVTDNSGDDTNATSPLVVDEEQIISENLNQVSIMETEGQCLKVSEGSKGEQEGNSSNEVIQTTKHFDKNADDHTIKEEEFEEPKVTNEREKIDEDINKETLTVPAIEYNRKDVTSGIRENIAVANIGDEEEPEEPSTIKEPENKIENDTEKSVEKSENVSSLVSQALREEVYEAKMKDTKNYAEKADTAPPKVIETASLTEVEPVDKPLEEASNLKSHLPKHEIEKEDLEKAENLVTESESHVQEVYEITRSPSVEESGADEIEKIIREVPEELSAAYNDGENGESETKIQVEDKEGLEGSDAVSQSKDQNIEEIHETKTSVSAEKNEEVSENNEAETSKSKRKPEFHGIEEIKEIETPIEEQIPTKEEKDELNPVAETGNTVDEIENETTDKTETELINPEADENKEEKLSELTLEPNIQCVEGIDEIEPKPLVSQTQEGKETEEQKDVPEAVFEPTAQNVEEVNETSSKAGQIKKLNREAPEEFSEPTNQVVEAVNNEETVTPTVAIALTSSKEFQINGDAEDVTDTVSSEKNIEMTEKADSSQQDEGVEKIIPEDASTSVSDYAHEDVKIGSAKIDEEVGEARTPITKYEYKDQVVEDAHETDLSSAVDERNINEIAKVEKDVTGELPEAINENVEAETEGSPDQEITKSEDEDVQEAKASVPVIQYKALSVEEMNGFDPTHSNFQGVGTIIEEEVLPNQTLLIQSKEQLMKPCSTLVDDQHHETTTEVEMVKSESINKNDTRLNEDTADLLETDTTGYEVQRELDISNSDVAVQESQNEATEKEIDEESIDENMKYDQGESKLINDQINAFGTSSETTIAETIETVDTTTQDSEVDSTKIQETSNVESQLLSHENETEACEITTAENEDTENLEAENSKDRNVEEIHETDTSPALENTETSEIHNKIREVPRVINQVYETDSSDENAHGQKIQAENLEAPEAFSEPTNQVVQEVSNDDFTAPTVATELTSSKEFQLGGAPENVTNSSAENIETTEKADSIQQDEGIEKIVLENASNAVSEYVHEDEEKDSESFKVDEEVGEARTVVTISENKDQVVEHARETDLSSAVDESNVNEIDGEVERNTEDNQLLSIRKMNGAQNGDKLDMKTDENNSNPASEHTDCSQGTAFGIEKVSDVCLLTEKKDDTLTAQAILSQQDSTETSFKEEDGSQNKSSESPLTEKVDSIKISKQELDHEAKDMVEDNLNDKSEALGNVEMLVTEAPEEIETTSPGDTPDQNPAKEDVTTIAGDIKEFASSEEKKHAAIDLDEKNEEAEVAATDNSGDDTNTTSSLVVDEEQIISEKLNQVSIVETEGQGLMVSEGFKGEHAGNSPNEVIQTTKHFDKNSDDQIIKEEEFEEPKVTNEIEEIEEDINKETLTVPAIECNCEDVTSDIRENITVANIGDEEELEEPSTLEEPKNIENDTEKSENVSSLVSQALKEEVYEVEMEDTKNYAEKADTAPPRILETTSLTEVEPFDKPLEEASIMKAHLPEHEIENDDLERAENLNAQSESHVQAVQEVYEITRSPNVDESAANEIEKIIREVPKELSEEDNNGENGESETKTQVEAKTELESSDVVSESKDQNISVSAVKNEEVSENNEAETSKSKREPDFHGIEEIQAPIAGQIPTEEEKAELNPVPEIGNTVDEIQNETTDKTETELINPDADEDKKEKLSELTLEPNVLCVEEIEPKPLVSQTQEGKEAEELKDVPEAVFEPTDQTVEEVNETSSKAGQIEKLNREAPEEFSEPTNQIVEAVNNEETVTPTVAIALTSSKEFQLNGDAEDVTDTVSSEKNIETTGKPDISQQDEGIEKIIPEDASTSVSDYAHEDVKIGSAKIDEEVGEARTPVTMYEYKDQVVEDVETETKGSPDQEITKSIAEDVQEAKASVPVIQSKALSVEEMDGFDPTHSNLEVLPNQTLLIQSKEQLMKPCSTLVDDQHHETTTEVEGESKLINDHINAFGTSSETTIAETIETVDTTTQNSEVDGTKIPETSNVESQFLSRENETEACERTTAENKDADNLEAENSEDHNVEEIHETDTSPALGDTETSEIDNKVREAPRVIHQVYAADSSDEIALGQKIQAENRETPEAFSEPTNQVEEVSNDDFVAPTVATELTNSKEFQMDGAPENVTNSSAENIETTEKTNNSQQDEGIVKIVLEDASTTVSDYVQEDEEQYIDEEVGEASTSDTISEYKDQVVEVARETDVSSAMDESNINEIAKVEKEVLEQLPEAVNEDISPNQTHPIESKEQPTEPFSVSVKDQHHETVTEVEILKPESINKNDTWLNEDTTDLPETGTTETVVQKEVEISNSDVTVQDTQSGETEKVIDEENIEEKMKCDDGADTSATTGTEVTLVGESELVNEPINAFGTSSETTNPGTIETFDVSAVCESSTVDSQLLAHKNETEVCKSFTAETDAENVEFENSEVPAAESELLVHNVEEIHQTDTSPAVEDASTSEVEKAVREVPGVINQVYEADSSDEISHDRKIQAENTVDPIQVSSFVFLPSEESHESRAITMDNTEDGHMKKDDIEENNLKPLEVTGVDAVKAEEALDVETGTDDEANERPLVIGGLEEERQKSSSALLSEKQDETEESKISETKTETSVLGVQEVYENETSAIVEETHADEVEKETKEALETIDIGVITDRESVSNQTFLPEIIESTRNGVEDTDIAPPAAKEVKIIEEIEPSDEAAKDTDISSESKAQETMEVEGIKPEEASIVELTRSAHENKETHESVTAEKTDADNVEVKDKKVLDAESEYLSAEEIHGAKANPVVGETDTDESENVVREVPKALPEGNNQGPEADSNDVIIPSWTGQAENIEEEVPKLPSIFLSREESQENVTTTTENKEDESEKVTQEVLRALPEGINQGPEAVGNDQIPPSCTSQAENIEEEVPNSSSVFLSSEESHETSTKNTDDDSLKLQETFGVLSQPQTIETKDASVADEVEAEEAKGSDAIYESKDHIDDIHETKSSPSAEISDEVNMEEATSNEAEKISDVEAIDVPADESTSESNCPTEKLDIGANITNSADDKPEEVIISELIPESGVLNVEEIQTETSPSVAKTQYKEEDETKTVLETTFQPDHEDVADIIARYIISNQTFPDENKEDKQKEVEETDILPAAVVEEASIGKINPIDEVVKASCYSSDTETQGTIQTDDTTELKSEISKSQLHEYETEKIAHENVVPNVQEIQNTSTSPSLGESDAIGSVDIYDNEETKSCRSVTEPKEQAVEDFHVVVGADMNESDQETREAPKEITKEINQDAGEVAKEEVSAIQHNEVENIEETGFVFVPEAKDQSFEEAHDTKTITAAKTPNIVEVEEDGTQVLEQIYGETYTGVEASVDGQTQATRTVPETVFEASDQYVGEIISKDIKLNDIVQNESKPQQNEPCVALLKDQDQETVAEDGVIKVEDKIQTDVSSNENAIDSFEAGTEVEKSSSKPVDESKESFDLDFEKIEKPLNTDSENIHVFEVDPTPRVINIIDEQLEKSAASMRECESETRIENTTEAAQAIHEITSKETLTEEPEKAETDNPLGEPITADNSNVETPEQVSVRTKSVNAIDTEEGKNEKYTEDEPITEFEDKEYESLATESTRSIEEVKGLQALGKPEDKLGDYNEKDETGYTNIKNFENRVEKENMENESHEPACEKNGTKESVGIAEQEPTANVADFPSIKTTTDEELAVKDEIMLDAKQRDFILDPVPINSRTDEKVEKLVMLPTTNKQEALGDVTEPSKAIMEPQEEKKISLSLSQAQIAKKEYLSEEKENKNAIASTDFQVIQETKHGEDIPEAIEKMTPNDPAEVSSYEILHKPADQTKQINEEPKIESEEKGLVEEEKMDEEEENEHKRADSGSDAPVMVEASKDIDIKMPHKKSHNILSGVGSKVKHSIAKVKKAITGKSSNQKSSSPKEDKKTEAVPLL